MVYILSHHGTNSTFAFHCTVSNGAVRGTKYAKACNDTVYGATVVALSYERVCDYAVCGKKSMRGHVMVLLSMVPPYATASSLIMLSGVPSYAKSYNCTIRGTKSMQSQLMVLSMVPKLSQWSLTEQSFHSVVHGARRHNFYILSTHTHQRQWLFGFELPYNTKAASIPCTFTEEYISQRNKYKK
jgi:hypothetical protein